MKHNRRILFAFSLITFFIFFSGIIRDDVSESKYLELAKQIQFDCVGQVFNDTVAAGSCVLITEQSALTAAHVLLVSDIRKDTLKMKGQTYISYTPINLRVVDASKLHLVIKGRRVNAKKITLHPEFLKNTNKGRCDIALIEFDEPISNISAAKVYTRYDELSSIVTGVGYGASGKAGDPASVSLQNKKIAGENVVDRISGAKYEGKKTILSCDFDSESKKGCNKMGSAIPRPLEYICAGGDSGGGLFKHIGDEWFLVGVCSGGQTDINQLMKTGYYGQIMQWTRISVFANWINSVTKK